ncbi:MAG: HAD-IC family P-type ATPase, partial [Candidatus Methanomethylicus sp.]|nr:HAD-IC family P-type ATPase [Candidatus Methanomethylicus sp.]
ERNMTYLGFVAIMDPPREGVHESVQEVKNAGIKPIMVTGDSIETARSIASQVGIIDQNDLIVEGREVQALSEIDFSKVSVFARISPKEKIAIVDRFKAQKRVVAMTGDGVNDAPAISAAEVGIAMGITGTDVTKQAADMVVADDSYNSIVKGIREGRGVFQKIQAIIFFYIAVNLAEAIVYFGASFLPQFFLLNTWQQMYVFLLAHTFPPFALIIDSLSKDVMKERPRDEEGIFSRGRRQSLMIFAASLAVVIAVSYFTTLNGVWPLFEGNQIGFIPNIDGGFQNPTSWSQAKARTMLHTVIFIAECTLVLSIRRMGKPLIKSLAEENNWIIWPLILLVPLAHLLLMYVPQIQTYLGGFGIYLDVVQLTAVDWLFGIALGAIPILLLELHKIWLAKRQER